MAEWLKAHAWKACKLLKVSRVRIPLSPPLIRNYDIIIKMIMKKRFMSGKLRNIYFQKGKKIISKNIATFLKKNNLNKIIRLQKNDFDLLKKNKIRYTHFNIKKTVHKKGDKCLIVRIIKPGFFDGKISKQPIFSSHVLIYAKCLSSKNNLQYNKIKKTYFKHSLSNIKNIKDLKKAMIRRYKKSLFHMTNIEKLSLGVGITELKIIKKYNLT